MNWYKKIKLSQTPEANYFNNNFLIALEDFPSVKEKIQRLSNQAIKWGFSPIEMQVSEPYQKNINNSLTSIDNVLISMVNVTIRGSWPDMSGWEILAQIHHIKDENSQQYFNQVETYTSTVDQSWWNSPPHCQSCNSNRDRTKTFILEDSQTKERKQIGSSCLGLFIGTKDPNRILRYYQGIASLVESIHDDYENEDRLKALVSEQYLDYSTEEILAAYSNLISNDKLGYVSYKNAPRDQYGNLERPTTAMIMKDWIQDPDIIKQKSTENASDKIKSKNARAFILSLQPDDNNKEFLSNIQSALQSERTNIKTLGLLGYVIPYYDRLSKKEDTESTISQSEFMGGVGQKVLIKAKIESMNSFNSDYGTTILHKFKDMNGNIYIWWGSKHIDYINDLGNTESFDDGDTILLTGTIKGHKENKFKDKVEKQTILTRCQGFQLIDLDGLEQKIKDIKKDLNQFDKDNPGDIESNALREDRETMQLKIKEYKKLLGAYSKSDIVKV